MTIQPFTKLSGKAAPMPEENIDTDIIFPARFLLITARDGLGRYAFHDRRFDGAGAEAADYVLNQPQWRDTPIIVAGANFGCGSSREQAAWCLLGHGVRCVIAPSFGEIFRGNCLRNGILPITLADAEVASLQSLAGEGRAFAIDLEAQTVTVAGLAPLPFAIDEEPKRALINGWDETDLILAQFGADIARFEQGQRASQPWLYLTEQAT